MLFQARMLGAYELVSRNQTAFARRERLYAAGCPVTRAMISQFGGVLHKPRIGIIPDPFPPGESGLATRD